MESNGQSLSLCLRLTGSWAGGLLQLPPLLLVAIFVLFGAGLTFSVMMNNEGYNKTFYFK